MRLAALAGLLSLSALAIGAPVVAHAQAVKPWAPVGADSITSLVSEAKVRFRQATTDTIDDQSIIPFERVGQAARRLLRRLGRNGTLFAPSIGDALDSLGLQVEVVNDPKLPSIVLVMVHNPYRLTQQAVGYLLWYRGVDLRMQGVAFPPCLRPQIHSWWSGRANSPYATAFIYEARSVHPKLGFKYLELSGDGFYWNLVQYEGNGPELGLAGDATFVDMNGDGQPELVSWSQAPPDSILITAPPVHPMIREAIYTNRGRGFVVHDARVLPGPLATLDLFLSWLREGKSDNARHLLVDPMFLDMAQRLGWADFRNPRNFLVDMQEEGQSWPEWLGARITTKTGAAQRWVFHFTLQDGHWLIKDWLAEQQAPTASQPASPDSTGGRKP